MGGGNFSYNRSTNFSKSYAAKSQQEIFKQKEVHSAMNPNGISIRESRDSEEHPESFPIIICLDVTGSMGSIPLHLIKHTFPDMMQAIISGGIKDPQVLFLAIGDHKTDEAPLQVSQFESSDELLNHWLKAVWLEGNGGGNGGESYFLGWYFAAKHTVTDSFEKRSKKGVLITIGDEPCHKSIPRNALKGIMGFDYEVELSANDLLQEAKKTYDVFHILISETSAGNNRITQNEWRERMGNNLKIADRSTDVAGIIQELVIMSFNKKETIRKKEVIEDVEEISFGIEKETVPDEIDDVEDDML